MVGSLSPELLGGYFEPEPSVRWIGVIVIVAVLCAIGIVERIQFRLRFLEARTWWASNGRDVLNAAALAGIGVAIWIYGFRGPVALVIAASVILLVNTVQASLGTRKGATVLSILTALLMGAPVVLIPRLVDRGIQAALMFLF